MINEKEYVEVLKILKTTKDMERFNEIFTKEVFLDIIKKGNYELASEILDLGRSFDINLLRDDDGNTPILIATKNNDIPTAEFLINNGAIVNTCNYFSETPLKIAVENHYYSLAKLMLDNEADIRREYDEHGTILHIAVVQKNTDIVKLLLDYGADIKQMNSGGNTPVQIAELFDDSEIYDILVGN